MKCLNPRSKLNDKNPTVAANKAVVYYPMSHYEKKNENRLNYKRDVCDVLVASRP